MNTKEKFGLEKSKAILLFIQMILSIIVLITSIYSCVNVFNDPMMAGLRMIDLSL